MGLDEPRALEVVVAAEEITELNHVQSGWPRLVGDAEASQAAAQLRRGPGTSPMTATCDCMRRTVWIATRQRPNSAKP